MFLLPIVMIACVAINKVLLRKIWSTKVYDFFIGPIALLGYFFWAIPLDMGYYEFFRAMF
jgi:hypothetical protein